MSAVLTQLQLTGQEQGHLVACEQGHFLHPGAVKSFQRLQQDAQEAGHELALASSFRSYQRQLAIFNGKAGGERAVHDDRGKPIVMSGLPRDEQLHAILRFSALPGTSRHHWGTDLDVFDAAAVPADYQVQLSPAEVAKGGVFDAFHRWLDGRIEAEMSHGFFRPYAIDRGGVAAERWHLSYAPVSNDCEIPDADALLSLWRATGLLLLQEVEANLEELLNRYVVIPEGWCPGQ